MNTLINLVATTRGTDFIQVRFHSLLTTRDFTKKTMKSRTTLYILTGIHQVSLERLLLSIGDRETRSHDD